MERISNQLKKRKSFPERHTYHTTKTSSQKISILSFISKKIQVVLDAEQSFTKSFGQQQVLKARLRAWKFKETFQQHQWRLDVILTFRSP